MYIMMTTFYTSNKHTMVIYGDLQNTITIKPISSLLQPNDASVDWTLEKCETGTQELTKMASINVQTLGKGTISH